MDVMDFEDDDLSTEEITITPQYIIQHKPNINIVRDFFKANLLAIKDEDEINFECNNDD
jgi:hypothetical protein